MDSLDAILQVNAIEWGLTQRQTEVLMLAFAGMQYKQIAAFLYLSENSVRSHMRYAFRRLGVRCLIEALRVLLGRSPRSG